MRSGPESLCSRSAFRPFPRPRLPRRFCRVRPRFARWRIGAGFAVASGLRRRQSRRSRLRRERRNGLERGQPRAPRRPPSRTKVFSVRRNGPGEVWRPGGPFRSVPRLCAAGMPGSVVVASALRPFLRRAGAAPASAALLRRSPVATPKPALDAPSSERGGRGNDDAATTTRQRRTREDHYSRSTSAGSVRVARMPGITHAATAPIASTSEMATSVTGSPVPTSYT
jgi:hypothetical protein